MATSSAALRSITPQKESGFIADATDVPPTSVLLAGTPVFARNPDENDGDFECLIEKSKHAIEKHKWSLANRILLRCLKLDRNSVDTHFHLALAYLGQNKLDDAELHAREVIRINPKEPNGHLNLGAIKEKKGDFKSAIRNYNYELKLRPDCMEAHYNVGRIYFERRRWSRCVQHLRECFVKKHQGDRLYYMLGYSALKRRLLTLEMEIYERALRENPKDVWAMNNWAAALMDQHKTQEARSLLTRALAIQPDDDVIKRNLAKLDAMK